MEQTIDMFLVGCMAFICALALQEAAQPLAHTHSRSYMQTLPEATSARLIGLSPLSFALLPSDIAGALGGQRAAHAFEMIDATGVAGSDAWANL